MGWQIASNVLVLVVLGLMVVFRRYLFSYSGEKGRNLATKEDIAAITRETEKVKAEYAEKLEAIKIQLGSALEDQKAFLERGTRLHDRQVDALCRFYGYLWDVQRYLQRMTAGATFGGEISREEYGKKFASTMNKIQDEFGGIRLLLPEAVAEKIDSIIGRIGWGNVELGMAGLAGVDGNDRAKFWKAAQDVFYEEVPKLLLEMEADARSLIHSEAKEKHPQRSSSTE